MPLLATAMIADLQREAPWLAEVAALAAGPVPVSSLRALDILAWRAGQSLTVAGEPLEPERDTDPLKVELES